MNNQMEQERKDRMQKAKMIALACLTGIACGAAIYCGVKNWQTRKLVNAATKHISDLTAVDVEQSIVDLAIRDATNREVSRAVTSALLKVESDISEETARKVKGAVQQSYGKLQKAVTDAIAREAAKVDKDDIMREATERAKELMIEKFDGKLDNLLEDYNRNLENVSKIYQSIASSMTDKKGKEVTLSL